MDDKYRQMNLFHLSHKQLADMLTGRLSIYAVKLKQAGQCETTVYSGLNILIQNPDFWVTPANIRPVNIRFQVPIFEKC